MENVFTHPLLMKLQKIGQKVGSNKFVTALQGGMMFTMSLLMVGAVFQILCTIGTQCKLFTTDSIIYTYLHAPYEYTMNMVGLWVTVAIAFNYAKMLKMKSPLTQGVNAGIIFLMTCANVQNGMMTTSFLGSSGMFIGFVLAFCCVRIEKLCADYKIRIPLPEICPPSLVNSMAAIVPLFLNIIIFFGTHVLLTIITEGALSFPTLINSLLYWPLSMLVSTPGMFIIVGSALILWCFGINGTMVIYPVLMADMINAASTNAALHEAGQPLMYFPSLLFASCALLGGSGNTWPLVLLGLKAKSEQIRAVSKISFVPGFFGINEPCVFGMPIMYNPILCIPYVLNPLVIMACYYVGYHSGIIIPPWISITTLLPIGFGAYLGTLNLMNAVFVYLMIIPSILIWYPFFKVYDNQLYAQEQAAKALEK